MLRGVTPTCGLPNAVNAILIPAQTQVTVGKWNRGRPVLRIRPQVLRSQKLMVLFTRRRSVQLGTDFVALLW